MKLGSELKMNAKADVAFQFVTKGCELPAIGGVWRC